MRDEGPPHTPRMHCAVLVAWLATSQAFVLPGPAGRMHIGRTPQLQHSVLRHSRPCPHRTATHCLP